jgi:hypothetical protein
MVSPAVSGSNPSGQRVPADACAPETLLASSPLPTAVLRHAVGLQGRRGGARFAAAMVQLGRTLVCTSFGTEQVGSGGPSVVLELTARAFDLGPGV